MDRDATGSGGATGLFGTVARGPVKEDPAKEVTLEPSEEFAREPTTEPARVPVRPAVAVAPLVTAEPLATAASGGFTQLLRALNYDQVRDHVQREPVKAELPPVSGLPVPASMEGSLSTAQSQPVETPRAERAAPAVPVSSSQVTSFLPPVPVRATGAPAFVDSVAALPVERVPPAEAQGSFTQTFQRLKTEPIREDTAAPSDMIVPSEPGSFTQLFATPKQPRKSVPEAKGMSPALDGGSFTQLFAGVEVSKQSHDSGEAPFQTDAPERAYQPEPVAAPASVSKEPAPTVFPAAHAPDSFTQMFRTLGEHAPEAAALRAESPVEPLRRPESRGSFTQMFQALGSPAAEAASPRPEPFEEPAQTPAQPGSFTQMFAGTPASPPVEATPRSHEGTYATSAPEQGSGGASQVFSIYQETEPKRESRYEPPVERGPIFSPTEPSPMGRGAPPATSSSGGLTQLLRTLDQPGKVGQPYVPTGQPQTVTPPLGGAPAGSFTGVYGELNATPSPMAARPPLEAVVPAAPMSAPVPVVSGPSEFTRLINASALREAGLRGGGGAAVPVTPTAASSSASSPGWGGVSMPAPSLPGLGGGSISTPSLPGIGSGSVSTPTPSLSGLSSGSASTPYIPGIGSASVSTPGLHAPEMPQAQLPGVPKAGAPATGLQKYVPLLLILVIFLLAAILVAVVVLMKK